MPVAWGRPIRGILNIAIVGYGTAGQALAILLSGDGHRVEVFERAAQPGPVGAGFMLQPTGLQVLWQMGLLPSALAHGAPVTRLYGETPGGRAVMDMRYAGLDARMYGLGMQRGALFTLLAAAWQGRDSLHRGTRVTRVDHDSGRLLDEHGRHHGPYDLVVAADGSASQLRGQVAASRSDRVYPWGALWCLLPRGDWAWPDELRQRYVAARKMIGMLPVGTRPGDDIPATGLFLEPAHFRFRRLAGAWAGRLARGSGRHLARHRLTPGSAGRSIATGACQLSQRDPAPLASRQAGAGR